LKKPGSSPVIQKDSRRVQDIGRNRNMCK
jgi:hypothetical protein